jgi:hypothetical protein
LGNSAALGGGLYIGEGSRATLTNCTISGNAARQSGGALTLHGVLTSTLVNCTISDNWALEAGGVECDEAAVATLTNCIVYRNTPESVCENLSQCLTDRDPLFVHPGVFDFGRFKTVETGGRQHLLPDFVVEDPDYHLLSGSPAIDAGATSGAPTTDMEGHGRPCGPGVDIGAHESGDCPTPSERFARCDADSSGHLTMADPILILNHLFRGEAPPPCLDAADADDSGRLSITDAIYCLGFQFLGWHAPPAPFPGCGIDPTIDGLGCRVPPDC